MGFHVSSVTCTVDGLAHLVSDDAAEAGIVTRRGTYGALCGHIVRSVAMVSVAGQPCRRCSLRFDTLRVVVSGQLATRRPSRGRHARRNRLQRLLDHHLTWAPSQLSSPSHMRQFRAREIG